MRLIRNIGSIRTSLRQNVHSLPPSHRSPYLERHSLAMKKKRLEQELACLERRRRECQQQLAELEAQMKVLVEREMATASVFSPSKETDLTRVPRMTIRY